MTLFIFFATPVLYFLILFFELLFFIRKIEERKHRKRISAEWPKMIGYRKIKNEFILYLHAERGPAFIGKPYIFQFNRTEWLLDNNSFAYQEFIP